MDKLTRRRASAEKLLISQRNYRRARDRALTRLAVKYKKEYLQLLEEEKANDVAFNKKWRDISGAIGANMDSYSTRKSAGESSQEGTESDNI